MPLADYYPKPKKVLSSLAKEKKRLLDKRYRLNLTNLKHEYSRLLFNYRKLLAAYNTLKKEHELLVGKT